MASQEGRREPHRINGTYLSEATWVPVYRGALGAEGDWLGSFSTNITIGERVRRSGGLHQASGGESTCSTSEGRNSQQKLGHGQQRIEKRCEIPPSSSFGTERLPWSCRRYVKHLPASANTKGYVFNQKWNHRSSIPTEELVEGFDCKDPQQI